MKKPIGKNAMLKLWAWLSLCINIIALSVVYAAYTKTTYTLMSAIAVAVIFLLFGINKIDRDISLKDLSISSVTVSYISIFLLSAIFVYLTYLHTSFLSIAYMLPIVLFECVIAIFIYKKR